MTKLICAHAGGWSYNLTKLQIRSIETKTTQKKNYILRHNFEKFESLNKLNRVYSVSTLPVILQYALIHRSRKRNAVFVYGGETWILSVEDIWGG